VLAGLAQGGVRFLSPIGKGLQGGQDPYEVFTCERASHYCPVRDSAELTALGTTIRFPRAQTDIVQANVSATGSKLVYLSVLIKRYRSCCKLLMWWLLRNLGTRVADKIKIADQTLPAHTRTSVLTSTAGEGSQATT
jgi:hypothetical protein